jgi:hypothetical protein
VGDLVRAGADTVIWLDYPKVVVMTDPANARLRYVRLRTPGEARLWLAGIEPLPGSHGVHRA